MQAYPVKGELWRHHSGREYRIVTLTNTSAPSDKFPVQVVYENTVNGSIWSRPLSDWHRSFGAGPIG